MSDKNQVPTQTETPKEEKTNLTEQIINESVQRFTSDVKVVNEVAVKRKRRREEKPKMSPEERKVLLSRLAFEKRVKRVLETKAVRVEEPYQLIYLPFSKLIADPEVHIRKRLNENVVSELMNAIIRGDAIQPLIVTGPLTEKGEYLILDGYHRYEAYKRLINKGFFKEELQIPCVVKKVPIEDLVIYQFRVNKVRANLRPIDYIRAIRALLKKGTPKTKIAEELGVSRRMIYNYLDIAEYLTEEEIEQVEQGKLSVREAIRLAQIRKKGGEEHKACKLCGRSFPKSKLHNVQICEECLQGKTVRTVYVPKVQVVERPVKVPQPIVQDAYILMRIFDISSKLRVLDKTEKKALFDVVLYLLTLAGEKVAADRIRMMYNTFK